MALVIDACQTSTRRRFPPDSGGLIATRRGPPREGHPLRDGGPRGQSRPPDDNTARGQRRPFKVTPAAPAQQEPPLAPCKAAADTRHRVPDARPGAARGVQRTSTTKTKATLTTPDGRQQRPRLPRDENVPKRGPPSQPPGVCT